MSISLVGRIDPYGGYAYFGTDTFPGRVVKVKLSDMTRDSALTLPSGEDYLTSAVIDPAGDYAYFGTSTSPGKVVKVKLSDMTRDSALTLPSGEEYLWSAVIDPAGGYAYFGTWIKPGVVVKVDLSPFSRDSALTLNSGENVLKSAVIDPAGGYAYFGTDTSPGIVVQIDLGHKLMTVTKAGTGSGQVTSSPAGIVCGTDCSEMYSDGTVVTLIATADTGSTFTGWSGACSGTAVCEITMDEAKSVTATFTSTEYYVFLPVIMK